MKFSEIYFFPVGKFMYCYKIGLLPNVFKQMFFNNKSDSFLLYQKFKYFYFFAARTNIRLFGIRFQGPKLFNSLNNNIKSQK